MLVGLIKKGFNIPPVRTVKFNQQIKKMEIIFNDQPDPVKRQLAGIKVFTDADGTTGIFYTMMQNKSINYAARIADCDAATVYMISREAKLGQAKGKTDQAGRIIKQVKKEMRNVVANGKSVLPEFGDLTGYGFDIEDGTRLKLQTKAPQLKIVALAVGTKIASFTSSVCPLTPFITLKGYDIPGWATKLALVVTLRADAADLRQSAKGDNNNFHLKMEHAEIDLRDFAAVIHEVSGDDPAAYAKYYFLTRNTPTVEKNQVSKILPTEYKGLERLAKLTLLHNRTGHDLWVRKGKRRTGAFVILLANGTMLVTYGYGTCTIQNPSDTAPAEVSATVNRKAKKA